MVKKILIVAAALFIVSCAGQIVRYSPYELQDFRPEIQEHIKNSEVALGMSPQAVRYSWGGPRLVHVRDDVESGYTEEWIYTRFRIFVTRLIFTEGKLTGIISGSNKRNPLSSLTQDGKTDAKQENTKTQK